MKLGDFLNTLAGKAGKTEEIKALLNNAILAQLEIDDTLAGDINSALLTIEGAKNNQTLKTHFSTLALNGVDAEISSAVETLGFDDAVKTELAGEKNTYQRYRKLTSKVKDTLDALKAATQNGDPKAIEKYTAQINRLNGELASVKESHVPKSELETLKKQHEGELTNFIVKNTLSTKKYALENVAADINISVAQELVNKALAEKGAVLVKDGTRLKLMQASDHALEYYVSSNKAVSFNDFVDRTLADANFLAVSNPRQNQTPQLPVNIPRGNEQMFDNSAAVNQAIGNLKD
jgi:hypothetical protein